MESLIKVMKHLSQKPRVRYPLEEGLLIQFLMDKKQVELTVLCKELRTKFPNIKFQDSNVYKAKKLLVQDGIIVQNQKSITELSGRPRTILSYSEEGLLKVYDLKLNEFNVILEKVNIAPENVPKLFKMARSVNRFK